MVKYYKKVTIEKEWTQPALTNNGIMGGNSFAVSSDELYYTGEFQTYYGFDNNNSTVIASAFEITSFNVYVYNPVALAVSNISIICPGPYVYEDRFNKLTVYGSNDGKNYELIQSFQTEMKTNYSFNLSSDKKYKYYRLLFQNNGRYFRITEIKLTAQEVAEKWQECNKSEYGQLPDDERKIVTDKHTVNTPKYLKKVTVWKPWNIPILTSNGVWGGDSFAVDSPLYISGYYPFYAFDGSTTGTDVAISGKNPYKMYFPIAVNISNIKSVGYHDSYWLLNSYRIAYSDDDITYTNATEILTATNYTINANIDKAVGCHKYWEIVPITCSSNGWSINELYIQAQELSYAWQECTKEEYDQLPNDQKHIENVNYIVKVA